MNEIKANNLCRMAGIILGACAVLSLPVYCAYGTQAEVTFTVTGKERVHSGQSGRYLVFTDAGTFEVTDSIFHGRFDSSDLYGRMQEGKTYRAKVYGFRIEISSAYQNILSVEEVSR